MENRFSPAILASSAVSEDAPRPTDENSFADILSEFEQQHGRSNNESLEGIVVSISPESVFVDIGRKMEGVLPVEVFRDAAGALTVHIGDRLRVTVTGRDQEGSYTLSTTKV